jgi:nucleoside-diphosphate-sugar epimerase
MQHRLIAERISEGGTRIVARILVTGASGFIGAALCPVLLARGHRVVAGTRRAAPTASGTTTLVVGDIGPAKDWSGALAGFDAVIHLAQHAHSASDAMTLATEPLAVATLAHACAASRVKRLVLISSVKAMGEVTPPGRPFHPTDPPHPQDAYGRTKLASERAAREAAEETGIELVVIRPTLVYGPSARANFRALLRLAGSELPLPFRAVRNRRSLIFLDNLVDLLAIAATHPAAAGQTLLARDGEDLSTPQLIRALARGLGRRSYLYPVPGFIWPMLRLLPWFSRKLSPLTLSLQVDDSQTRALLGWVPPVSVAKALSATAHAFARRL